MKVVFEKTAAITFPQTILITSSPLNSKPKGTLTVYLISVSCQPPYGYLIHICNTIYIEHVVQTYD